MHHILPFLDSVSRYAAEANVRYPIFLEGSQEWCQRVLEMYFSQLDNDALLIEVYGDLTVSGHESFPMKKGLKKLGQETNYLVIDVSQDFDANAINAVCGTLVGGGLVFFMKTDNSTVANSISQWIMQFKMHMVCVSESNDLLNLPLEPTPLFHEPVMDAFCLTQDQCIAVEAIQKVATGRPKRPLIITADRGRGKSSSIGIAILTIILAKIEKQQSIHIGITAPQRASVEEIFTHALRIAVQKGLKVESSKVKLRIEQSRISYIAPDDLIKENHDLDVLCVDEAAAIPAPMLLILTERYSRIVFSTTVNGYEGTGRGFEIKFKGQLAEIRPNYRAVEMVQPIRWNENDPLEKWLSSVFLLNHKREERVGEVDSMTSTINYRSVAVSELLSDHSLAQSLFSLLVSAHYQTSPNDWIALLTDDTLECWIGYDDTFKQVVCCALLSKEGELETELIESIQLGTRRPKGHLAPVSLTQVLCLNEPAQQRSIRIMRIAVATSYQNKGVGSACIIEIENHYAELGIDYLSTSFGATAGLNSFWRGLDFRFIRLGISKDKASGLHSLLAIKPLSSVSQHWLPIGEEYYRLSTHELLMTVFSELGEEDVLSLLPINTVTALSAIMMKRIEVYSKGGLGVEVVQHELRTFILNHIDLVLSLSEKQRKVIVMKCLQTHSWLRVVEQSTLTGRKEAEQLLRQSICTLLSNLQCKL